MLNFDKKIPTSVGLIIILFATVIFFGGAIIYQNFEFQQTISMFTQALSLLASLSSGFTITK